MVISPHSAKSVGRELKHQGCQNWLFVSGVLFCDYGSIGDNIWTPGCKHFRCSPGVGRSCWHAYSPWLWLFMQGAGGLIGGPIAGKFKKKSICWNVFPIGTAIVSTYTTLKVWSRLTIHFAMLGHVKNWNGHLVFWKFLMMLIQHSFKIRSDVQTSVKDTASWLVDDIGKQWEGNFDYYHALFLWSNNYVCLQLTVYADQ